MDYYCNCLYFIKHCRYRMSWEVLSSKKNSYLLRPPEYVHLVPLGVIEQNFADSSLELSRPQLET